MLYLPQLFGFCGIPSKALNFSLGCWETVSSGVAGEVRERGHFKAFV